MQSARQPLTLLGRFGGLYHITQFYYSSRHNIGKLGKHQLCLGINDMIAMEPETNLWTFIGWLIFDLDLQLDTSLINMCFMVL